MGRGWKAGTGTLLVNNQTFPSSGRCPRDASSPFLSLDLLS